MNNRLRTFRRAQLRYREHYGFLPNYILKDKKVMPCKGLLRWAVKFDVQNRRVALTQTANGNVSTVFLGLDHGWGGRPLYFETMVFGGTHDGEMDRYKTYKEALWGHGRIVRKVRNEKPD